MAKKFCASLILILCFLTFSAKADAIYDQAYIAFKAGNKEEALKILEPVPTETAPYDINLLRGRIYLELNKYDDAEGALKQAWKKDPEKADVAFYLGKCYFKKEQWLDSIGYIQQFLKVNKKDDKAPDALLILTYNRLAMKEYAYASRIIASLDPLDEKNPAYYYSKAALAFLQGKDVQFQELTRQAKTVYGVQIVAEYEKEMLSFLAAVKEKQ
jgi:tetratricopeptide (TPR) repeat protein